MKKKILWVSHFLLYPETGFGALQRSRNLLLELCNDFEVSLVCLISPKETQNFDQVYLNKAKEDLLKHCSSVEFVKREQKPSGLKLFKFLTKPLSVLYFESPALEKLILEIVNSQSLNLIFSDTLGLTEGILDKIQIPIVLNHHNLESEMMDRRARRENSFLKKLVFAREAKLLSRYEKKYCERYKINLMVSENDRVALLKKTPKLETKVIPNPVDTNYFNFRRKAVQSKILCFIGGLTWYPNLSAVNYFLEFIWPEILKIHPDAIFKIVGKFEGEIEEVHKNVVYLNFVPDIREVLASTRVFVCPIIDGGGTRLKIIDAVSSGVPVVSTSIGVEGLEFKNEKEILIADNPNEFAKCVDRLLIDDELGLNLAMNAKKLLDSHYSLEVVGQQFSQLIKEACS